MFDRTKRSWSMMKQSWAVLQQDKTLMLFPIMSSIACALIVASFALPVLLSPALRNAVFTSANSDNEQPPEAPANIGQNQSAGNRPHGNRFEFSPQKIIAAVVAFLFYLVTNFVGVFFNSALVFCAMSRFSGGNPPLGDGLTAAVARLPQILGW